MRVSEALHADTGLPLLSKRAWEKLIFEVDFGDRLDGVLIDGIESIAVTSTASTPGATGLDTASHTLLPSDDAATRVAFLCTGGTAGEAYKVRIRVTLEGDVRLEDTIVVEVQ